MLFVLFKNVDECVSDPPKIGIFEGFDTGAAIFLESPNNLALINKMKNL